MSLGGVAWLIVAIAILLLFGSISLLVYRIMRPLKNVLVDIDIIAREADELMVNTNSLLNDVNNKVAKLDPAVQAVADVGTSVSDLNTATKNFTSKANAKSSAKGAKAGMKAFSTVNGFRKNRKDKKAAKTTNSSVTDGTATKS